MQISQTLSPKTWAQKHNSPPSALKASIRAPGSPADNAILRYAGISVTDERKSKMEFTDVYFEDNQAILVPKNSKISSVEDLKNAKVGAQQATSGESYAKEKGADVVQYEDTNSCSRH